MLLDFFIPTIYRLLFAGARLIFIYRKCYGDKLARVTVPLPMKRGEIDEEAIQAVMKNTPYWQYLSKRLAVE